MTAFCRDDTDVISFYINFSELASWLTLKPLMKLIEETGVEVEMLPVLGSLGNVVTRRQTGEDDPLEAYKARRARARQQSSAREFERICERLDLEERQASRHIDPLSASLGLIWLKEVDREFDQMRYAEAVFEAAFRKGVAIGERDDIEQLIDGLGLPSKGFKAFADIRMAGLVANSEASLEAGILSAPAFVLHGEVFHGREHLPLLAWLVKGSVGPPPV